MAHFISEGNFNEFFAKNDRAWLSKFTWEETDLKQVILSIINTAMLT